jgi:hypothetical protein
MLNFSSFLILNITNADLKVIEASRISQSVKINFHLFQAFVLEFDSFKGLFSKVLVSIAQASITMLKTIQIFKRNIQHF